jgi:hypothetical protein
MERQVQGTCRPEGTEIPAMAWRYLSMMHKIRPKWTRSWRYELHDRARIAELIKNRSPILLRPPALA